MTKTLDTTGFFEFFTKFSTPCGKLYLQVEKFFHISFLEKNTKKRSALAVNFFLLTRKSYKKNKKRAVLSL